MTNKIKYLGVINKPYFSRYANSQVITDNRNYYYEAWKKLDLSSVNYITYTVKSNESYNWTLLASEFYNEPLYWWMIALFNNSIDPFEGPLPNTQIKIPYKDDIILLYSRVNNL